MVKLTCGQSEAICVRLNHSYRQCRLANDVVRYCPLWKQGIVVLCNETGVDVAKLELWVPGKVVKKLNVGAETYNL